MNKFDVKKLIKVSAVALAMISAGGVASAVNANTNVHADEDLTGLTYADATKNNHVPAKYAGFVKISDEEDAKEEAHDKAFMAKLTAESEPDRKADALSTLREGGELDADLANDPVVKNYLESKGYSSNQISNSIDTPEKDEKQDNEVANEVANENNKIAEYNHSPKMPSNSASQSTTAHYVNHNDNNTHGVHESKHVAHVNKHTRLSKATVRKIMKQMRVDKRAIRSDKKRLSTRSARKFMRNYTKATKSVKRAKREQKRAMATKGAKRYLRYYKDEVKHEKDLVRLTKSTRASKVTKRSARKSLKQVRKNIRKNRKDVKRAHKVIRAHKHGRKAHK